MFLRIGVFIVITLLFTVLLAVLQQKINLAFEKITLPQLAPAIGFIIVSLIFADLHFSVNFNLNKTVALRMLMAFVLPFLLFGIPFLIGKQAGLSVKITGDLSAVLPTMAVGLLIGAAGEEIGWRGFLQPILEKKYTVLVASIVVGTIWGLWHIGHYRNGALFMTGFLLFTVSASILIAWLLRGTHFNIIIATAFHLAVNLGFTAFFKNSLSDSKLMLINGFVWLIPVIILFLKQEN
jgi:membrane protease YdiL (CAAX protease family)